MKYYYLLNGKLYLANSEMPSINTIPKNTLLDECIKYWQSSIKPCEITEGELEKIKDAIVNERFGGQYSMKTSFMFNNETINVTDLVEEKKSLCQICFSEDCPDTKYNIIFKHPKQVDEVCQCKQDKVYTLDAKCMDCGKNYFKQVDEASDKVDYKKLLKKYINHIVSCEGYNFFDDINSPFSDVKFTELEETTLRNI